MGDHHELAPGAISIERALRDAPPPPPHDSAELRRIARWLRDAPISWSAIARTVAFDAARFLRRRVHLEGGWEWVLCAWLPGQATPVHDHGDSVGVVRILVGELLETRYGGLELPAPVAVRAAPAGSVLVEDRGIIHRVRNVGTRAALSLHLYAPPLGEQAGGATGVTAPAALP